MLRVFIASSRKDEIGNRCYNWAGNHLPEGFELTGVMSECDICISVLYDTLLTPHFLKSRFCYNFHPGVLPSYRGSGVYSWAILNGEQETGVTLHKIDKDIDSGPIIEIRTTTVGERDTAGILFDKCMDLLFEMFCDWFTKLLMGEYTTQPNEGGTLYLRKQLEAEKDISHIIKAFTFKDKESAYWYDSKGKKHYVEWE